MVSHGLDKVSSIIFEGLIPSGQGLASSNPTSRDPMITKGVGWVLSRLSEGVTFITLPVSLQIVLRVSPGY